MIPTGQHGEYPRPALSGKLSRIFRNWSPPPSLLALVGFPSCSPDRSRGFLQLPYSLVVSRLAHTIQLVIGHCMRIVVTNRTDSFLSLRSTSVSNQQSSSSQHMLLGPDHCTLLVIAHMHYFIGRRPCDARSSGMPLWATL